VREKECKRKRTRGRKEGREGGRERGRVLGREGLEEKERERVCVWLIELARE